MCGRTDAAASANSIEINVLLVEEEELNNVKFIFMRMIGVGYYNIFVAAAAGA
jgi:hypothetical protein